MSGLPRLLIDATPNSRKHHAKNLASTPGAGFKSGGALGRSSADQGGSS